MQETSPKLESLPVVMLPVYNDWVSLEQLLQDLDGVLQESHLRVRVLIIDDYSSQQLPETLSSGPFKAITEIVCLRLRRNLSHQRAITVGLTHIEQNLEAPYVVVMDSDGEDSPADVPRLIERFREHHGKKIIFAERRKRSESLSFRIFYWLYRTVHFLLTGHLVRVGNFSVIPRERLTSLVVVSDMWNHYAAAVYKSRQPYDTVPTSRAQRIAGKSKLNFVGLVIHGLSAMSVFGDTIGVRLLVASCSLISIGLSGLLITLVVRLITDIAIPGWATALSSALFLIIMQAIMLCVVFTFMILNSRNHSVFLPLRDALYFVAERTQVYPHDRKRHLRGEGTRFIRESTPLENLLP